jgi:hypothetical protein
VGIVGVALWKRGEKESGSFLKKRTKKLLGLGRFFQEAPRAGRLAFFGLFFKKRPLS